MNNTIKNPKLVVNNESVKLSPYACSFESPKTVKLEIVIDKDALIKALQLNNGATNMTHKILILIQAKINLLSILKIKNNDDMSHDRAIATLNQLKSEIESLKEEHETKNTKT